MRLFISVNFDEEVRRKFIDLQEAIRAQTSRGRFSEPGNLHLTLVFLGETEEERLPAIRGVIDAIGGGPFELLFTHSGCFTHSRKELWWIGAGKEAAGLSSLTGIRRELCAGLRAAGIAFDDRPFNAHVTLGREIKHDKALSVPGVNITVPVRRVSLMKSEHIKKPRRRAAGYGCSHKVFIFGFHTFMTAAERRGMKPSIRIKKRLVYTELFARDL